MTLDVHLFPCLNDNYGFLVRDRAEGVTAAIDSPDAEVILAELEALGWGRLDLLLNTHWHPDHTGGNARLQAETGCRIIGPAEVARAAPLDQTVVGGETVMLGRTRFQVIDAPGHTLGHVIYHCPEAGLAFVGDVIFPLGCGRLFEGTAEQMWASLSAVAAWPEDTALWGAHEYAAANARFAVTVDDGPELAAHAEAIFDARAEGRPTIPTTVGVERRFNPFLTAPDVETFAARRAAKDGFRG